MTKRVSVLTAAAWLAPALLCAQPTSWTKMYSRGNQLDGQAGPVIGRPFSGTEVRHSAQVLADGTHVDRTDTSTFQRDDRGRMRTANDKTILIFDPVAGFNYSIDLQSKTYSRERVPERLQEITIALAGGHSSTTTHSGDGGRSRTRAGAVTEELPPQTISGISAKGSRITTTIPAGSIGNDRDVKVVNERWYSDDLQVLLKSTNNDPRFGVTTYELTNIVRAQPDPALFLVPSDYRLKEE